MRTEEFLRKWLGLSGSLWGQDDELTDAGNEAWSKITGMLSDLIAMGASPEIRGEVQLTLWDNA